MDRTKNLPLDIWDGVLEELAVIGDRSTIATISLTERGLRLPSQRVLFRCLKFKGGLYSVRLATIREVVQHLRNDSNTRFREYVRRVELNNWILSREWLSVDEQSWKQIKMIYSEVLSLLEHLPRLLSLKFSHLPLENDTLERLCAKLPNLTNVELGYCTWTNDNPAEDATSVTTLHAVKDVRIDYCVPSGSCTAPGGRIQIPAMLHAARALIQPSQIQRLSLSAYHGMDQLMMQLASSKSHFPRLVSLTLIHPPASSSSDIISFLRRCPALEELIIDRRDSLRNRGGRRSRPNQKIQERDSISNNTRAFEEEEEAAAFVSSRFLLPNLKAFTGSLDETIAILKLPGSRIERLEVHWTLNRPTTHELQQTGVTEHHHPLHEPLPNKAIDELMNALEMANMDSRNHVVEFKCIDKRWGERDRYNAEQPAAARKISKPPPQRVREVFPNLGVFTYRGPNLL